MIKKWNLREIVLMSILGVVFAVIYLMFYLFGKSLRNFLTPFGLGPFAYEIIFGIWYVVSIISAYIIRRPGAAFISESIAGLVQVLIGSPAGPKLIIGSMIQGIGAEVVFAATRYRNFTTWVLVLAGVSAAIFSFTWAWFTSGFVALSPMIVLAMFVVRMLSGALLAGLLGKWISDQLANTGVLRSYALGRELQAKREEQIS